MVGIGNLVWVPLATKYGRRPVYVLSFLLLTGSTLWCALAPSFESLLAARIVQSFACSSLEIVAPLLLADVFFLHQRGSVMV